MDKNKKSGTISKVVIGILCGAALIGLWFIARFFLPFMPFLETRKEYCDRTKSAPFTITKDYLECMEGK